MSRSAISLVIILIILAAGLTGVLMNLPRTPLPPAHDNLAAVLVPFDYTFNTPGILEEAGRMDESSSPYWWLNSGGVMTIAEGRGSTNTGNLPGFSKWRILYNLTSAVDTDKGYRPQNIFRLVSRSVWENFREEVYFRIIRLNTSDSPNRNQSNGILLFLRYVDGDNLYYAGLRVDGTAVIKRKKGGMYRTLAQTEVFPGSYDRLLEPSLLPENRWIGVRSEIQNLPDGSVRIDLYGDLKGDGQWVKILQALDQTEDGGILERGFTGIRTDFMDVEFRDFSVVPL